MSVETVLADVDESLFDVHVARTPRLTYCGLRYYFKKGALRCRDGKQVRLPLPGDEVCVACYLGLGKF